MVLLVVAHPAKQPPDIGLGELAAGAVVTGGHRPLRLDVDAEHVADLPRPVDLVVLQLGTPGGVDQFLSDPAHVLHLVDRPVFQLPLGVGVLCQVGV